MKAFCSERFFKVNIATAWTDVLAIPSFIVFIDQSAVSERNWSILYWYLEQVPDTYERYILSSKYKQPTIPKDLKKFFKTAEDRSALGEYILRRNKKAVKHMDRTHRFNFINERRKHLKKILNKEHLPRELLLRKLAKYYNTSLRTIQRDVAKVSR